MISGSTAFNTNLSASVGADAARVWQPKLILTPLVRAVATAFNELIDIYSKATFSQSAVFSIKWR